MTRTAIRRIDKLENCPEARGGELIPASHKAFKSMTISFPETPRQLKRGDLAKDRADAVGNVRHNGSRGDCHEACHQGVLDLALHLRQVNHFCLNQDALNVNFSSTGRLQFLRTRSVAELSEAVRSGFDVRWVTLEEAIRTARTARELAVEQYESHRSAHELKVIGAGSGTLE